MQKVVKTLIFIINPPIIPMVLFCPVCGCHKDRFLNKFKQKHSCFNLCKANPTCYETTINFQYIYHIAFWLLENSTT